jgi:hypothetical protein
MSEADLMRDIQVALSAKGHRVFRNNIGMCQTREGQMIRYGVCNPGGSDLIGWTKDGKFLAVEVKVGIRKLTPEQDNFLKAVIGAGGIGVCARSLKDVENI